MFLQFQGIQQGNAGAGATLLVYYAGVRERLAALEWGCRRVYRDRTASHSRYDDRPIDPTRLAEIIAFEALWTIAAASMLRASVLARQP